MPRSRTEGSVRIGPISLFALLILLSLAVLAVLTLSTAQATYASSTKQINYNTDVYTNDSNAQRFLSNLDADLHESRQKGFSRQEALRSISEMLPANAWIEGDVIQAKFSAESGRVLAIEIAINEDVTYSISRWQASTDWDYDTDDSFNNLWSGSTDED